MVLNKWSVFILIELDIGFHSTLIILLHNSRCERDTSIKTHMVPWENFSRTFRGTQWVIKWRQKRGTSTIWLITCREEWETNVRP